MANRIRSLLKRIKWWDSWVDHFGPDHAYLMGKNILELGAGPTKRGGVKTLDINSSLNPDIVHDLNAMPWPISDSCEDAIYMFSLIEHVLDPLKVIEECHRILKPGGKIYILTPHFSSSGAYVDLTHKWHLSGRSFDYFIPGTQVFSDYGFYSNVQFKMLKRIISLQGMFNYVPFFQWFANRYLCLWEDYFCFLVRGSGIYIVLEKQ